MEAKQLLLYPFLCSDLRIAPITLRWAQRGGDGERRQQKQQWRFDNMMGASKDEMGPIECHRRLFDESDAIQLRIFYLCPLLHLSVWLIMAS